MAFTVLVPRCLSFFEFLTCRLPDPHNQIPELISSMILTCLFHILCRTPVRLLLDPDNLSVFLNPATELLRLLDVKVSLPLE